MQVTKHHASDKTIWLGNFPILWKNILEVIRAYLSSTSLMRGFGAPRLFRVPSCRRGTMRFQTSIPSPGFELKPYGTVVSFTNQYTREATYFVKL
ncbi:hypothetical protein TNCV_1360181 [Trichonephila clavipes]|nr:hypothetical protein TNCV_1360181 [Trichonephila clavipes]